MLAQGIVVESWRDAQRTSAVTEVQTPSSAAHTITVRRPNCRNARDASSRLSAESPFHRGWNQNSAGGRSAAERGGYDPPLRVSKFELPGVARGFQS